MKARNHFHVAALFLAAAFASGCSQRHIVAALPQSVAVPPLSAPVPPPEPTEAAPSAQPTPAPAPPPLAAPEPLPTPAATPAPTRPRPAPEPSPAAAPEPPPAPPQIAPALTPQQEASARRTTTTDVQSAEKNLQAATGKRLNDAQKDLVAKVQGFLSQAHEAIMSNDWVRAQNLASKAQILSVELTKSIR